ncbi:MAG: hypothetical protein ASQ68_gp19 [Yellowstone Lake virophage 6]|uniref:hypothetical protein n=1 Tax=Yellowstone Lake virophage 6 TaxID=1557034 RepID=UPI000535B273|nr:MAG: hypothetical protein ASQ68_gp19 [Yellowstone Lake virophage 6]AIW01909.1 MAG: hypothetical protein YSLV6_ORF19 [Yellowstone Lake virophage 6]
MPNPWIEFVKKYAKENDMSYACAIVPASKVYQKKPKLSKIEELRKYYPDQLQYIINLLNKYKRNDDFERGKQLARQKINSKTNPEDFINI